MEALYSDHKIEDAVIQAVLRQLFPDLQIFKWDFLSEEPAGFDRTNQYHIVFHTSTDEEKTEFQFLVEIYRTPESHSQARAIAIAQLLAKQVKDRIYIPYTLPEAPHDPSYGLVFHEGEIFLADDSNTNFADGTDGQVKMLKSVEVPDVEFDRRGNLIS
ncbi:MAG: hypothetical protein AAFR59_20140 [Bacteroidota bacterium]